MAGGGNDNTPWVAWYPQAFLADTWSMSLEVKGAYIMLLCVQANGGRIPNDLERLQGVIPGFTVSMWRELASRFEVVTDPETGEQHLQNPKMRKEVEQARSKVEKATKDSEAARDRARKSRECANSARTVRECFSGENKKQKQILPPQTPPGEQAGGGDYSSELKTHILGWAEQQNRRWEAAESPVRLSGSRIALAAGSMAADDWNAIQAAFDDAYTQGVNDPKQKLKNPTAYVLNLVKEIRHATS